MVERTARCYFALSGLYALATSFIGATYVIFLLSHGLTIFEAQVVNAFFYVTLTLFEIPTGVVADVFGRKLSFVGSCFVHSFSMFLYFRATSFTGFVVAEIVGAIGITLMSGAFQAWMVDQIKYHGHVGGMGRVFAREQQISKSIMMVGALAGGFLGSLDLALPWLVSSIILGIVGVLALLWMKEDYFVRESSSPREHLRLICSTSSGAFSFFKKNAVVRFVFGIGASQVFAFQAPNMQWQPLFEKAFSGTIGLGFLRSLMTLAIIAGALVAIPFLARVGGDKRAIVLSQVGAGVGIILTVLWNNLAWMIVIFLVHEVFRGINDPLKSAYLNQHIPSRERATILSMNSIAHHIGGALGLLVGGFIAWKVSFAAAWVFSGSALVLGTLVLSRRTGNQT
ncbi:MAG: MFS transporter [Patescibacteria group bacterium]